MKQLIAAITTALLCLILAFSGVAQEETEGPRINVGFETHRLNTNQMPIIDGNLDDEAYKIHTPQIDRELFWNKQGELIPEGNETSVWMFQTPEGIFVAAQLFSAKPEELVATLTKDEVWGGSLNIIFNDLLNIALDFVCSHQYQDQTWIMVNPVNTRTIKIAGGKAERLVTEVKSATQITEYGWSLEVFAPFYLFLLPGKGEREIYVNFDIRRQYLNDQPWHWCWMGENDNFAQMGKTTIDFPKMKRRTNILVDASVVKKEDEIWRDGVRSGFTARQDITSQWKTVISGWPGFEDVVEDIETADFSRQETYRREKRPLLQEAGDLVGLWPEVYTRRIRYVDFGVNSHYKRGAHSLGVVGIVSSDPEEGNDYLLSKASLLLPGNINTSWGYVGARYKEKNNHIFKFCGERKWPLFDLTSEWAAVASSEETGYRGDTWLTIRAYNARIYFEHYITQKEFYNPLGFYRGIEPNTEGVYSSLLYEKVWEREKSGIAHYLRKLSTYHYFGTQYFLDGGGFYHRMLMFRYWIEGHSGYAVRCILTPETWEEDKDIELYLAPQKIFKHTEKKLKYAFGVDYRIGHQKGERKNYVKPFASIEWYPFLQEEDTKGESPASQQPTSSREDKFSVRISHEVLRHIEHREQFLLEANYDFNKNAGCGGRLLRKDKQWLPHFAAWRKVEEPGFWPSTYLSIGEPNPYAEKPDIKRIAFKAEFRFDLRVF